MFKVTDKEDKTIKEFEILQAAIKFAEFHRFIETCYIDTDTVFYEFPKID